MARVTVEDCVDKIPNRFDLVLAAGFRARQLFRRRRTAAGAGRTRTRSWPCAKSPPRLSSLTRSRKNISVPSRSMPRWTNPRKPAPKLTTARTPRIARVTEEELLRALTTEAQRRAEPQPEPEADYEE